MQRNLLVPVSKQLEQLLAFFSYACFLEEGDVNLASYQACFQHVYSLRKECLELQKTPNLTEDQLGEFKKKLYSFFNDKRIDLTNLEGSKEHVYYTSCAYAMIEHLAEYPNKPVDSDFISSQVQKIESRGYRHVAKQEDKDALYDYINQSITFKNTFKKNLAGYRVFDQDDEEDENVIHFRQYQQHGDSYITAGKNLYLSEKPLFTDITEEKTTTFPAKKPGVLYLKEDYASGSYYKNGEKITITFSPEQKQNIKSEYESHGKIQKEFEVQKSSFELQIKKQQAEINKLGTEEEEALNLYMLSINQFIEGLEGLHKQFEQDRRAYLEKCSQYAKEAEYANAKERISDSSKEMARRWMGMGYNLKGMMGRMKNEIFDYGLGLLKDLEGKSIIRDAVLSKSIETNKMLRNQKEKTPLVKKVLPTNVWVIH